ncbi:MAG: hypothetical protein Q8W51_08840, partial [Candidatus Palauibacterales bacterium]|nr:hypothetical protein [Candidatus Palauibacterales bacterium]
MPSPIPSRVRRLAVAGLLIAAAACGPSDHAAAGSDEAASSSEAAASAAAAIQVVARDYSLQAPDSIPSGWVTFRFENQGKETHFFVLHHLPEGVTMQDYIAGAGIPFDSAMKLLQAGGTKADAGKVLADGLPAWYAKLYEMGGAGLVAPGGTTRFTEKLPAGTYLMECYVKNRQGTFHSGLGMLRQLTVTGTPSGGEPPTADLDLTLSAQGIAVQGTPTAGQHIVAVHYQEQPDGVAGYDVHLARLGEGHSVDGIIPWMDWMNVGGLVSPAPADFL